MPTLVRVFSGIAGVALISVSAFFLWVISFLVSSEVMPAVRDGSFNVETSTMILNIVWEGNQIYILLAAYLLLAGACMYGAIRFFRRAVSRQH